MQITKLSIIIPAFNEQSTIEEVLQRVMELPLFGHPEKEVIVINDCSTDQTGNRIDAFIAYHSIASIRAFHQPINKGKGAAIHKGIELATGDYIVIQDADLELDPNDINALLKGLSETDAKVIYGSRFLEARHSNTRFWWHIMGNGLLTRLSNIFTGIKLTDMMTCYKLIPSTVIKSLHLKENRFGFEPEVTVKLAKIKGLQIKEVPISYAARDKAEGKKINWKDGIRVMYCLLRYRLFN
jgi:glycosyltransferase involved in cell wall biosynthesis